jgi:uncharacterized protein (DUF1501 family)
MSTNRREFLKSAGLAAAGCVALQAMPRQVSASAWHMINAAEAQNSDAIIVVINLDGGNDGLNTIVPVSDAQYSIYERLRPNLKIPRDQILRLSDNNQYGFNPVLTELRDLYEQGNVAIIAGVGVPHDSKSKFDHAAGIYDFVSADPYHEKFHSARRTGWLGRAIDGVAPGVVPPGIDFGGGGDRRRDPRDDQRLHATRDLPAREPAGRSVAGRGAGDLGEYGSARIFSRPRRFRHAQGAERGQLPFRFA